LGIVAGLAIGIDAVAHEAALDAGGYTVAVLGSGLNRLSPRQNQGLARRIARQGGAVISEQPADMPGFKQHFPARNRIISGLSLGVVVTEAAASSGSAITAQHATDQNREVMAVPGNITSLMSAGTNNLIRAGATPVTSAADVLTVLNLHAPALPSEQAQPASRREAIILELLDQGASSSHELIARSGFSAADFAHTISLMEITGKVRNLGAATWIRR
jgi:DNA processing protein